MCGIIRIYDTLSYIQKRKIMNYKFLRGKHSPIIIPILIAILIFGGETVGTIVFIIGAVVVAVWLYDLLSSIFTGSSSDEHFSNEDNDKYHDRYEE